MRQCPNCKRELTAGGHFVPPSLREPGFCICEQLNRIDDEQKIFATHKNIERIGDGELAWCADCKGGEIELYEQTCEQRQQAKELTKEEHI